MNVIGVNFFQNTVYIRRPYNSDIAIERNGMNGMTTRLLRLLSIFLSDNCDYIFIKNYWKERSR